MNHIEKRHDELTPFFDSPMPYEEYRTRELLSFARKLVIAFFAVGIPLAILVYPWGQ